MCDINADCINTPGSYRCRCKTGYEGSGTACQSKFEERAPLVDDECVAMAVELSYVGAD